MVKISIFQMTSFSKSSESLCLWQSV